MPEYRAQTVAVPQLAGGVNLYDKKQVVLDNQLTAAENMWFQGGMLKTRPGLELDPVEWVEEYTGRQQVSELETLLVRFYVVPPTSATFSAASVSLQNGFERLGFEGRPTPVNVPKEEATAWGVKVHPTPKLNTNYLFYLSSGDILQENADGMGGEPGFVPAEPYIPTLTINGKLGTGAGAEGQNPGDPGSPYEGYNMLTDYFRMKYTSDGTGTGAVSPIIDGKGCEITGAKITLYDNQTPVEIVLQDVLNGGEWVPVSKSAAGITDPQAGETVLVGYFRPLKDSGITFSWRKDLDTPGDLWAPPTVAQNNITITAKLPANDHRLTICKMARSCWYGGDRSSIDGGTRLFVCGNPDKPNLIHWSATNKPLYFPTNNYAYIGDSTQKVVTFGRQGGLLVIFKERETYSAQYVAGRQSDYDFAKETGIFIDTAEAKFPIAPISAEVGCDCPDTVRLVNNRLVWATSSGKVYMLAGTGPTNERNIRYMSRNIQPLLAQHSREELQAAGSGEYYGNYLLQVGRKVYLLDAQSAAFVSFGYYSNEDKGRKTLAWYVWQLPAKYEYTGMVADGEEMRLVGRPVGGAGNNGITAIVGGKKDFGENIPCSFTSKLFDFGEPGQRKKVLQILLGIQAEQGNGATVEYITDAGPMLDPYEVPADGGGEKEYIASWSLTPNLRLIRALAIKVSSSSAIEINGLIIKYKRQGAIR